jgi:hypothetical protein
MEKQPRKIKPIKHPDIADVILLVMLFLMTITTTKFIIERFIR